MSHPQALDLADAARVARLSTEAALIVYPDGTDQPGLTLRGSSGYAVRCAGHIAYENVPDALWALEVLNRYGHLVPHPADMLEGMMS